MSGGRFDYAQYRIADIYTKIEDYVDGHPLDEEDERCFLEDRWLEEDEDKYVRKHHHTMPNRYGLSKETIKEFKKGIELLKKAQVYAQRIDWLLSGDDGEDNFHLRLKEDLANLKSKKGRTLLTAFAGSIGIIGNALILSISNGVNTYISDIQKSIRLYTAGN